MNQGLRLVHINNILHTLLLCFLYVVGLQLTKNARRVHGLVDGLIFETNILRVLTVNLASCLLLNTFD